MSGRIAGPWYAGGGSWPDQNRYWVEDGTYRLAQVPDPVPDEYARSIVKLIAAAPGMRELLQRFIDMQLDCGQAMPPGPDCQLKRDVRVQLEALP